MKNSITGRPPDHPHFSVGGKRPLANTAHRATVAIIAGTILSILFTLTCLPASGTESASLWPTTATPKVSSWNDSSPVELGVGFKSDVAGNITGVRFHKGAGNTGTHSGSVWNTSGQRLATGTFARESTSGWQTLVFSTPLAISPNVTYVASYFAPKGHYAGDQDYFTGGGVASGPLHVFAGTYCYGSSSHYPSSTYRGTNYWVNVLFTPISTTPTPTPTCLLYTSDAADEEDSVDLGG